MPLSPATSGSTQTDRAYTALRSAIVRCEFEPGERLRVEDLSQRLQVSSSPLREALSRLVAHGLVNSLENRGFRVAELTVPGVADLTRVRRLVETETLRDAMTHGDDQWEVRVMAALYALFLAEQKLSGVPALDDSWAAKHRDFHLSIYSGSPSPMLRSLVAQLFDKAERYRRYSARFHKEPRQKRTEHQQLVDAVLARDHAKACALLVEHISLTERRVTAALTAMDKAAVHPATAPAAVGKRRPTGQRSAVA